jgi:hypothetical protein
MLPSGSVDMVTPQMSPTQIYYSALATMRMSEAPAFLRFNLESTTTFHRTVVIQHFAHVERTADQSDKSLDVDTTINHNFGPLDVEPDLFLGHSVTRTPAPDSTAFALGVDSQREQPLTTIATVAASSPFYKISTAGIETLENCGATIHLVLQPRKDPIRYNLRDLWVDETTSRICRAAAVWRATVEVPTVATVTLDVNADGYITHFHTVATAHILVGTLSATQDAIFTGIQPADESAWIAGPKGK